MGKFDQLINKRAQNKGSSKKIEALATLSKTGNRSGFSGVFAVSSLTDSEREELNQLLLRYGSEESDIDRDLSSLEDLTCEVKAINNQAAILHGERIKRAQTLLKSYQEGAFTQWLINTYGNRQTPYNFLAYYDFYHKLSKQLQIQLEIMPRQAIYTLASRTGELEKKESVIRNYQGETKEELLRQIRELFPLEQNDGRRQKKSEQLLVGLKKMMQNMQQDQLTLSHTEKNKLIKLLDSLRKQVESASMKKK